MTSDPSKTGAVTPGEADGAVAKPKKKNIVQVFRPQNSKTGMVKPGSRPRPQGQARPGQPGAPARPAGAARPGMPVRPGQPRPAAPGQPRPAGTRPAGAPVRPAGTKPAAPAESAASAVQAASAAAAAPTHSAAPAAPVSAAPVSTPAAAHTNVAPKKTAALPVKEVTAAEHTSVQPVKKEADIPQAPAAKPAAEQKTAEPVKAETKTEVKPEIKAEVKTETPAPRTAPEARTQAPAQSRTSESAGRSYSQTGRTDQGGRSQDSGRSFDGNSRPQGQGRSFDNNGRSQGQGRSFDGNSRPQGQGRSFDGNGRSQGQGRSFDNNGRSQGRSFDGNGRPQGQGRSFDGSGRSQGQGRSFDSNGRPQGQGRSFDGNGRSQGQGRSFDGSGRPQGQGRSFDGSGRPQGQGRPQGGRPGGFARPQADAKPMEKESRKRTERGDRNRDAKGEKLDRLEQTGRSGKKGAAPKTSQRTNTRGTKPAPKPEVKKEETIKNITIPETLTIRELGEAMKVQPSEIVKKLFLQGVMVTVNEEIDFDRAEEIALEFNVICEKEVKVNVIEELLKEEEEDENSMVSRPPVVCVMGHVDHGKTSLLDAIRDTHVIDREAGGITQHIGAYVVSINNQKITFLDTPGHEAFTAMRMRGANATDIAILVVAADDGVMPQTIEAINHAKAAGVEIIVAINKIDKPAANIDRVKQELTEYGLIAEDWGGSTVCVPVSAHTHEGIDTLLEMILLTAEVLELKANPKRNARGLVIEAQLDKGKGPVATVLVQKGTLHVGDPVAAGSCYGKVRAMMDDKGRRVKEAGPSTPVEILGLSDVPNAGEVFLSLENEKEARSFAETFISEGRERMLEETKARMSLDDLFSQIQAGNLKELNLIVKADVQGSVEAVRQSLLKLSNEEVVVKVIHSGVGAINESDVTLASASNAIIIGFNVRPDPVAKSMAEQENVDVRLYRVIYDAINDVEHAMKGMLDPVYEEKVIGHAEVRQTFKASGIGTIAGSYVLDGTIQRGCKVRITREGKQIYEGALASLKRFKDDVKEVKAGYECGLVFEKFNDLQELDQVEAYIMVEVPR